MCGHGCHFGHVTSIMSSDLHFLVPESFHAKFGSDRQSIWENIWLRNDLDLQYSHTFINLISCLYLPTFRPQASIVSEKFTVFTFSYRKA